ncbi:hypothetical protein JDV02_009272 [Purpureocillium takamizusanense]|uniref:Myb-like DNA-binding domain protein n=1 Tax=Purpureocillium takamizusanense TaxID=2060973 RepID=A0A9Q8QLR2_9HYPO|nr:uncharacterized protein JDV02_009272 [Purpureocillium takamizusanense]UNI23454.1 hypothetical protein JDV02_009272 [Purpureocillium takamizusanense]
MEPPAKKRRQGQSPFDPSGGEDDDELFFEPHEIRAKRDPGYKLSLERAYADNRFQATMAHIFEKYSRNFEGIGDEIDMVTGEIVINNGHLQNMRNEVDVGLEGPEHDVDDDDEGILLEDLLDEDVIGKDTRHYEEDAGGEDADEEDRIIQGQEPSHHSTALVPASHARATAPYTGYPSLLSGTFAGAPGGFDSTAAFGGSPLAFGASPFAMDPWGLPSLFSCPPWEPPDLFPKQPKLLPSAGDRYSFPAQDGGSSIWAPNYRFKEDEPDSATGSRQLGPSRPPARTRTRPMKYLLPPTATRTEDDDEEDIDEDAILSGKSAQPNRAKRPAGAARGLEEDPLNHAKGPSKTERRVKKSSKKCKMKATTTPVICAEGPEQSKTKASSKGKEPETAGERPAPAVSDAAVPKPQPGVVSEATHLLNDAIKDQEQCSRIQSGRIPSHVNSRGALSESEITKKRPPQGSIMVQIPSVPWPKRNEYEEFNDVAEEVEEVADSQDEIPPSSDQDVANGTASATTAQPVVLAIANIPTPQGSNASRKQARSSRGQKSRKRELHRETNSSLFALSDDELPLFPGTKPRSTSRGSKRTTTRASSPELHDSGIGDSATNLSSTEQDEQDYATIASTSTAADDNKSSRRIASKAVVLDDTKVPTACTRCSNDAEPGVGFSDDSKTSQTLPRERRERQEHRKTSRRDTCAAAPDSPSTKPRSKSRRANATVAHDQTEKPDQAGTTDQETGIDASEDQNSVSPALPVAEEPYAISEKPTAASRPPEPNHRDTPKSSPTKPALAKATPSKAPATPSKPHTPRHTSILTTRAPSSRRSILSLLSSEGDADDDDERELDELGRAIGGSGAGLPVPFLSSGAPSSRKIWKSSARTTEVYHTPIKRRPTDVVSPSSITRTPGGTTRTCGLDGYRCGRDFCFTCL